MLMTHDACQNSPRSYHGSQNLEYRWSVEEGYQYRRGLESGWAVPVEVSTKSSLAFDLVVKEFSTYQRIWRKLGHI